MAKKKKVETVDVSSVDYLEPVEGHEYFASTKGRLTNDEIVDNNLKFACVTGSVWNYFKL